MDLQAGRGVEARRFLESGYLVIAFEYLADMPQADLAERLLVHTTPYTDTLIPYRTLSGLYARTTLAEVSRQEALVRLRLFHDWLMPGGICYFSMYEGEGSKRIAEQGVGGRKERLLMYYQPAEIETLVRTAALETIDAWREQSHARSRLHIIVRRP